MRIVRPVLIGFAAVAALSTAACGGRIAQSLGVAKVTPDEFRVVSIAPLTVPPEYGLAPPAPGTPRPRELDPESSARQILLGERAAVDRSAGESALVGRAGADRADPLARYVVDDEVGDLAHKERRFADRLMFWRSDDSGSQSATETSVGGERLVIDQASEAARLQALTGGRPVLIERRADRRFKLPGL
ncbi:MAG TPA: DUF3035 domain-containing protein [Caulobacteraceae bacterium]|jgi:hypothetical protein